MSVDIETRRLATWADGSISAQAHVCMEIEGLLNYNVFVFSGPFGDGVVEHLSVGGYGEPMLWGRRAEV